tara:strand:+ start:108 stop:548 length:441 start_codon:yes stop_codon:yes gene_type:complete
MTKYISIDPGKCKCGLILADFKSKRVLKAIVVESIYLVQHIKTFIGKDKNIKVLIGNGTTSNHHVKSLSFIENNLTIVEEKNTTYRSRQRYFEIFPIKGIKRFLPRDIFLQNINLDAISALVILEDYLNCKFTLNSQCLSKTWMKQ